MPHGERGEHYRVVLSGDLSATHRVAQFGAQTHSLPGRLMAYAPPHATNYFKFDRFHHPFKESTASECLL